MIPSATPRKRWLDAPPKNLRLKGHPVLAIWRALLSRRRPWRTAWFYWMIAVLLCDEKTLWDFPMDVQTGAILFDGADFGMENLKMFRFKTWWLYRNEMWLISSQEKNDPVLFKWRVLYVRGFEWTCWRLQAENALGRNSEFEKFQSRCKNWQLFLQTRPPFREGDVNFVYFDCSFGAEKWWFESWQQCEFIKKKGFPGILCTCWISNFPTIAEGFCIFLTGTRKRVCLQIRCGQGPIYNDSLRIDFHS